MRTNLIYDTFTQDEFEALSKDSRMDLIKARKHLEDAERQLMEDYRRGISDAWMSWLHSLLDAVETLHEMVKE